MINSNILHCAVASPFCELQSLVFHVNLITGNSGSVFAIKYLLPLISAPLFNGYLLRQERCQEEIKLFTKAFEAMAFELPGFEFIVRENLSKLCLYLCGQFDYGKSKGNIGLNPDHLRIKNMLDYIHQHYFENISLSDIAKVSNVGVRECLRCFQRTIQISPMQYLLKYRLMQGSNELLEKPAKSISEIAIACGFDSPSNFSKMFKKFYNCTPREYRSTNHIHREHAVQAITEIPPL